MAINVCLLASLPYRQRGQAIRKILLRDSVTLSRLAVRRRDGFHPDLDYSAPASSWNKGSFWAAWDAGTTREG
jgi:hypothetical protein